MSTGPLAILHGVYKRYFPERQIYHRCNGQVQFTTVSGRAQIVALFTVSAVLGWVAYATVNVVFTEQINEKIKGDLQESKRRWETLLTDMQGDYERLHAAVEVVEDELENSLRQLEERQERVDSVVEQQLSMIKLRQDARKRLAAEVFSPPEANENTSASVYNRTDPDPTPRRSRSRATVRHASVNGLADVLRNVPTSPEHAEVLETRVNVFEKLEKRIVRLEASQYEDMLALEEQINEEIGHIETALDRTGRNFAALIDEYKEQMPDPGLVAGIGGPFVSASESDGASEELSERHVFARKTERLSRKLHHLAALTDTLVSLPVSRPTDLYRLTSGMGPRVDPFNGRLSMHNGLDFGGPQGSVVKATADGKITKAGRAGGYGNMVKIDHGNGFTTIFAHLHRIRVKRGADVKRGDVIGTVGNTGRSTAPHLHYEVKYRGKAVDPMKFLEAGRYVFENQRL